jgi:hypothetical protein
MREKLRPGASISVADYKQWPIWEFATNDSPDETAVRPVKTLPVTTLDSRFIGLQVRLANGALVWATIGNVDVHDERRTRQFIDVGIHRGKERFHLARYFDVLRSRQGPEALAKFLDLQVEDVFPIEYDLSQYVLGDARSIKGRIEREPSERLTRQERVKLNVVPPKR